MLKIVTDPAEGWPLEVADLRTPTGHFALIPKAGIANRSLRFPNPDGGINLIEKPRRSAYTLGVDWIDFLTYETILRIIERRIPIYLFPNFDASTVLSMPLQGSLRYWKLDNITQVLEKTDFSFTRASTEFETDRGGRFAAVDEDIARFEPAALGVGLLQDKAWTNDATPTHPVSGTLGWAEVAAPALAPVWDSEVRSPADFFAGSVRLPYNDHASTVAAWDQSWSVGSTLSGKTTLFGVWLLGDAEVDVEIVLNSFDVGIRSNVKLSMDRWTPIFVRTQKVSSGNAITASIKTSSPPDNSGFIYAGPQLMKISGGADLIAAPMWTAANPPNEVVEPSCQLKGSTISASWTGRTPLRYFPGTLATLAQCWRAQPSGFFRAEWTDSSGDQALRVWLNATEYIEVILPSILADQFYSASIVLDTAQADPTARLVLQVAGSTPIVATLAGRADFVTDPLNEDTLIIGSWGASPDRPAARTLPAHIRVDQRAWTIDEQDQQTRIYIEDGFRQILTASAGRLFHITQADLNPRENNWNQITGTISLEEITNDPLLTIAPR